MTESGARPALADAAPSERYTWPLICLLIVLIPQVLIPSRLRIGPPLLVPIVELVMFLVLLVVALRPGPVPRGAYPLVLWLFGLLILANTLAAARLVSIVLTNEHVDGVVPSVGRLLLAGTLVLGTNIVTFALLYWQLDGGGPAGRRSVPAPFPDFMLPQAIEPQLAPEGWTPTFPDYLYIAYTNVVAFSPTDTLPLTTRAKGLMAIQSLVSLAVLVVVLARVINILPA